MIPRLPLHIDADSSVKVDRLLTAASARIQSDPGLLVALHDGTFRLRCPKPDDYKPRMNHWCRNLTARISQTGHLFEINEEGDHISGGWMASCIPPYMYRVFLSTWLVSSHARQLELFA